MKTVMVAHRGAQQVAPENTLTAFKLAIKTGFKAVECDVQLSKDGHLVIIHDETVDRTSDGVGWVSQLTRDQIKQLTIGDTEHIPSLREVYYLVVVQAKRRLILEIKADTELHANKTAQALVRFIGHIPRKNRRFIEVHSFWYSALKYFKAHCPTITTAAIINGGFDGEQIISIAQDTASNGVSLGYEFLSAKIVRQCHHSRLFVDTWAISDGTVLRRLRPFGLNAVVENFSGKTIN